MSTKPIAPTCKQIVSDSQATNQLDRVEAALTEKARVSRVLKMRLGADVTDTQLAEQMGTSSEVICRWRNSSDRVAPTLVQMLLADDQTFDVLLNELLAARTRLGHGKRTVIDGDAAARSDRLVAALSRAQAVNDELAAAVDDVRRTR